MTKRVRIENADLNTSVKVIVQVWDKGYPEGEPDKLSHEVALNNPTDITGPDLFITSTRYLVVREV